MLEVMEAPERESTPGTDENRKAPCRRVRSGRKPILVNSLEAENGSAKPSRRREFEPHYRPQDLAAWWGFSERFVRELFRHEPGVMVIERPEKMHKRSYVTLRIPESVALRVHGRLANK